MTENNEPVLSKTQVTSAMLVLQSKLRDVHTKCQVQANELLECTKKNGELQSECEDLHAQNVQLNQSLVDVRTELETTKAALDYALADLRTFKEEKPVDAVVTE